jgi:ABC-type lipoprotein release transport system permease subunit
MQKLFLGVTSGILIGIAGAYLLTGISPHSSSALMLSCTIFVPSDLLHVWVISVLLSLAGVLPAWKASGVSPLEALMRN